MKYWAPINSPGGINGNDSYQNANPSVGAQGSIPTFQSFEQPLRGLTNLIVKSRMTPNPAIDDLQISEAIRSQQLNWTQTFGGTANALTAVLDPIPLSLALIVGLPIHGIAHITNTGPATLQVGGLSQRSIVTPNGAQLPAGALLAGAICIFMYDGTNFQLVAGGGGGTGGSGVTIYKNYHCIKQPFFLAWCVSVSPENSPYKPGPYSMHTLTSLGDATFNANNGNFTVGDGTRGLWHFVISGVPVTTQTNKHNIAIYGPGVPWGIIGSQLVDSDYGGGYSNHIQMACMASLQNAGDTIQVAHATLYSQTFYTSYFGIRVAGGKDTYSP